VQVVNNVGAIVFESSIESKATISLPTISKGVYFVKIKSANNKQLVKKIIVE
jgi:hypothetical protein